VAGKLIQGEGPKMKFITPQKNNIPMKINLLSTFWERPAQAKELIA
jgi:hypothetical protein